MGRNIRSIWESNSTGCGALDKLRGKIIETSMYFHVESKNRIVRTKEICKIMLNISRDNIKNTQDMIRFYDD